MSSKPKLDEELPDEKLDERAREKSAPEISTPEKSTPEKSAPELALGTEAKRAPGKAGDSASALPLPQGNDEGAALADAEEGTRPREAEAYPQPAIEAIALEPGRSLVAADFAPPRTGMIDASLRLAYRLGIPGSFLSAPFRKPVAPRLLATVTGGVPGHRARGVALRAGHFLIRGLRLPIAQVDWAGNVHHPEPFARTIHGFSWLSDLAASAPREQCVPLAERILSHWLEANETPAKGPVWTVERMGQRLLAWLVHGPIILSDGTPGLRRKALGSMSETARLLDRKVKDANDTLEALTGWCAIVAAGLLLPEGRARRLYGERGLLKALGDAVSDDGGVLSRSPLAQMEAIALLVDLRGCYEAAEAEPPQAIETMLGMLVPPLLALRHGDGGLGSWQGSGATNAEDLERLITASRIRTRPGKDMRQWGYQHVKAGKTILQFDAAPPPRVHHARFGCASTLAFELSSAQQRIIVNCGGAALSGGQTPVRIEQGLRGTAAHSALVLDHTNSTAVLIKGQIGKGVEEVDITRGEMSSPKGRSATRLEATQDGYSARFGLLHRRILILSDDGEELRGEDILEPVGKRGKRGKVGCAIRFHLGRGIDIGISDDERGAGLALPDGSYWQFRLGGEAGAAKTVIEESLWVDGDGCPHPIQQLVVEGLIARTGATFPWLLKKMG